MVALVAFGAAVAAAAVQVSVPAAFKQLLVHVKQQTKVAVLLPSKVSLIDSLKLYPSVESLGPKGYVLDLSAAPNCHEATACFVASFSGKQGTRLPGPANATLAKGDRGWFHPSTCGASCAPVTFEFVDGGAVYSFQISNMSAKNAKAVMIGLANNAVAAGHR